ncbi:MAG: sigma-54-dependent Fis family transcriptional regulator [Deferribacteres bacterium]|nr:sigma-54-dependent Fis family transcriptional regulator [Deferribacteres bacterium]
MSKLVLVVDDEPEILSTLKDILEDEGYRFVGYLKGEDALEAIDRVLPDLVVLDIWLPGIDGIQVLDQIKRKHPHLPVLIISGHGTIETAVKAVKLGAYDFIEKPIDLDKFLLKVERALEESRLRLEYERLREKSGEEKKIIGKSPRMKELMEQIKLVAPTDCWVLILGESGTGKELVAREIHRLSPRSDGPFVEVNCAAIPSDRIEYELFGYEKGSFAGAEVSKKGKFELANGGTLYFDEVGDMDLRTQAKVLRVLEELKVERVGADEPVELDIRVIASSNKDLEREVAEGNFRKDLYYRLNVVPIVVPPLRERKEDIPLLVEHFSNFFARKYGRKTPLFSDGALKILTDYHWPGNVRELKNLVERLVITVQKDVIEESDLPYPLGQADASEGTKTLREAKEAFEKEFILRQLKKNDWNISKTAEELGIERSHLYKKMRAYGIKRENNEV